MLMKRRVLYTKTAAVAACCVVAACIVFAAGELYARLVYKDSFLGGFQKADPVFHHLPLPYSEGSMDNGCDFSLTFRTNNRGMRGPGDYAYEKEDGVFRIAFLGDSFVFGQGVKADETASSFLEALLTTSGTRRYEVCNFGVNSYSPILEYIYLKKEAAKYRPDLVILMMDIADVQDDYYYEPHLLYGKDGDISGCDPFKRSGKPDWAALCKKYSRLFFMLDQKLFQSFRKIGAIGPLDYVSNKLTGRRNKTEILLNRSADAIYFDKFLMFREGKDRRIVMRHWARTAKYLALIKKYLDEHGIEFILVTYPYGHQVGGRQWSQGRAYWGFEPGRVYDPAEGFAIIEDFTRRERIGFINLYDALVRHKDEILYFDRDGHWTKRGHEVVGRALFDNEVFQRSIGKSSV